MTVMGVSFFTVSAQQVPLGVSSADIVFDAGFPRKHTLSIWLIFFIKPFDLIAINSMVYTTTSNLLFH